MTFLRRVLALVMKEFMVILRDPRSGLEISRNAHERAQTQEAHEHEVVDQHRGNVV